MYVERTLETFLNHATHQFPALLVTGARQVGKTSILEYLSQTEQRYVTLDDPMTLAPIRNMLNIIKGRQKL